MPKKVCLETSQMQAKSSSAQMKVGATCVSILSSPETSPVKPECKKKKEEAWKEGASDEDLLEGLKNFVPKQSKDQERQQRKESAQKRPATERTEERSVKQEEKVKEQKRQVSLAAQVCFNVCAVY